MISRLINFLFSGRKIARNVAAMATGEAPVEVVSATELPEVFKTIQTAVREDFSFIQLPYLIFGIYFHNGYIYVVLDNSMLLTIYVAPANRTVSLCLSIYLHSPI